MYDGVGAAWEDSGVVRYQRLCDRHAQVEQIFLPIIDNLWGLGQGWGQLHCCPSLVPGSIPCWGENIDQFIGKSEQVQKRLVEIRNMPHVGRMWGKGSRNRGRGQRITEVGEKKIRWNQSMILNTKNCLIELPFSAFWPLFENISYKSAKMIKGWPIKKKISGKTQLWLQVVRAAALADKNNESVDSGKLLEQMQRWFDCGNISFKQGLIRQKRVSHCDVRAVSMLIFQRVFPPPTAVHCGRNQSVFKSRKETFTPKPTAVP